MNYFNIDQVELWHCNIDLISEGRLRLRVAPIALSRELIWIEFYGVLYVSTPTIWSDVDFFLAPHEECLELLRSLRQENFTRQIIDEDEYKLFATRSADVRILAKDSLKTMSQR